MAEFDVALSDAFLIALGQYSVDSAEGNLDTPNAATIEAMRYGFRAGYEYGRS